MSAPCLALGLALAAAATSPQPGPCPQASAWRPLATQVDRDRLRDWRDAWIEGLEAARKAGKPAGADALFDPDRAFDMPLPPDGAYRCRFVKLGGAAGLVARDWGRCSVAGGELVKIDGPQRPMGRLYADAETRGVFLGTLLLGDETRPMRYGRDDKRDLIGAVERIGEARWRVALPRPGFESTLDLLELTPVGQ